MLMLNGYWALSLEAVSRTKKPYAADAARIVKNYLRPALLDRVPAEAGDNVHTLLAELQKAARPFRLMDLPSELRARIYSLVLQRKTPVTLLSTPNPVKGTGRERSERPPPLTETSHPLREEALPLYYQLNSFYMHLSHRDSFTSTSEDVLKWALANTSWLKNLRSLTITLKPYQNGASATTPRLTVKYLPGTGLTLEVPECDKKLTKAQLYCQADRVERKRKSFGLEGEAIAVFLTLDPKMVKVVEDAIESDS